MRGRCLFLMVWNLGITQIFDATRRQRYFCKFSKRPMHVVFVIAFLKGSLTEITNKNHAKICQRGVYELLRHISYVVHL